MKKLVTLFLMLFPSTCLSQNNYGSIKISPDLEIIKLSSCVYIHVSYAELPKFGRFASNGVIYINNNKAFLFDTPVTDSLTKTLVSWIRDSLKATIVGFLPNHWHPDCMGGLGYLQSIGVESYSNQMTIDIAKAKSLPIPAHGFKDSLRLSLGDKPIQSYYLGPAHSTDNVVVWLPVEKVLFAGCMAKSLDSKSLGNTSDGDLTQYPRTIANMIKKFSNAKIVIPGHGNFGGMDLLDHTMTLAIGGNEKGKK